MVSLVVFFLDVKLNKTAFTFKILCNEYENDFDYFECRRRINLIGQVRYSMHKGKNLFRTSRGKKRITKHDTSLVN